MNTPVEQIKERLDIAEVVGSYLKLERAGSSLKAKCPFHNERTPSFFVSPARGSYYCFGCGKGGDIFSFVQEFEGLDFVGALRVLASRAGVELKRLDPKVHSEQARAYLVLEKAARFFEKMLAENAEAKAYLATRSLLPATMVAWRIGFAPHDWRLLFEHLLREGCRPEECEKVGLIKKKEVTSDGRQVGSGGDRYYDVFRGRIMFPIFDGAGRVIAFSGRILPSFDDGKAGKYINSPETILFNKSETLYGFDRAKFSIRQKDAAILVEGQMDLLMAHQAGFANTVASSGTALTDRQLTRLKRLSENVLIAFDADSAGEKAALRAIHLSLSSGMNVRVIALTEKDPADLIAKDLKAWEHAVLKAEHIIDFLLGRIVSQHAGRERALAIEKTLLPLLKLLPSSVEQAHFIKIIAERALLREDAIWESFKKLLPVRQFDQSARRKEVSPALKKKELRSDMLLRRIFGFLFFLEERKNEEWLARHSLRLQEILGETPLPQVRGVFEKERNALLSEAEFLYGNHGLSEKDILELLENFEEERVRVSLADVMERLAFAEHSKNRAEVEKLIHEAQNISARLSFLKSARFANN